MLSDTERHLLKVAADLLDLAEQGFSNHGCNDYPLEQTAENIELAQRVTEFEGADPWDYSVHEGKIYLADYVFMQYCAERLREMAKAQECPKVMLTDSEIFLLLSMVSERIIDADKAGIPRDHDSSIFRDGLFNKLLEMRRIGPVVAIPSAGVPL